MKDPLVSKAILISHQLSTQSDLVEVVVVLTWQTLLQVKQTKYNMEVVGTASNKIQCAGPIITTQNVNITGNLEMRAPTRTVLSWKMSVAHVLVKRAAFLLISNY